MKRLNLVLALTTATLMSSSAHGFSAWNDSNRPELFEFNYERKLGQLPKSGMLTVRPWSGNYWATYTGGIAFRWNKALKVEEKQDRYGWDIPNYDNLSAASVPLKYMSPSEKYDIFLGNKDFPLTNYERKRTNIMKTVKGSSEYDASFKIATWEGLCHAWAPATINYDNLGPVTMTNKDGIKVEFGASDVKALLTYHLHLNKSPKTNFLGSRCNLDFKELKKQKDAGTISAAEYDSKINSSECKDTNAGSFHIVLANQIGKMDQGFIVDMTRDAEVWNQAVYSYNYKELSRKSGATAGAAAGTVEEVTIETKMTYIVEVYQRWDSEITEQSLKTATFNYRIELNNAGEIIGGEWLTDARPDFIWKSTNAEFKGYFGQLKEIYEASVSSAKTEARRIAEEKERLEALAKKRAIEEKVENDRINAEESAELSNANSSAELWVKIKFASLHLKREITHLHNQLVHDFSDEMTSEASAAINAAKAMMDVANTLYTSVKSGNRNSNETIDLINNLVEKTNTLSSVTNNVQLTGHQIDDFNRLVGHVNRLIKTVQRNAVGTAFSSNSYPHGVDGGNVLDTEEEARRLEEERLAAEEAARLEEERRAAETEATRLEEERLAAEEEARRLEEERNNASAGEAARLEEARLAAEAEATRLEEERRAAEEEARRLEDEINNADEEARRLEEERRAAESEAAREEARHAAEEARLEEERRREEAADRRDEERRSAEARRREEDRRREEARLEEERRLENEREARDLEREMSGMPFGRKVNRIVKGMNKLSEKIVNRLKNRMNRADLSATDKKLLSTMRRFQKNLTNLDRAVDARDSRASSSHDLYRKVTNSLGDVLDLFSGFRRMNRKFEKSLTRLERLGSRLKDVYRGGNTVSRPTRPSRNVAPGRRPTRPSRNVAPGRRPTRPSRNVAPRRRTTRRSTGRTTGRSTRRRTERR